MQGYSVNGLEQLLKTISKVQRQINSYLQISGILITMVEGRRIFEVVRMMFNLCVASGLGRWRLAMFLNDKGIKNRSGKIGVMPQ